MVHSVQATSQTSSGSQKTAKRAFGPLGAPRSKGLSGRSRLPSSRVRQVDLFLVQPGTDPAGEDQLLLLASASSEARLS